MRSLHESDDPIRVEYSDLRRMLLSHRDAVVSRIRQVARDFVSRLPSGNYDAAKFLDRIGEEIRKSRELFRGFVGATSGEDICGFLERNFTADDTKQLFRTMEDKILFFEDSPDKKFLTLTGYIEVVADEVFSKLVRNLRELER